MEEKYLSILYTNVRRNGGSLCTLDVDKYKVESFVKCGVVFVEPTRQVGGDEVPVESYVMPTVKCG